jgi:DNA-binding NarL/FixJ family response regulator
MIRLLIAADSAVTRAGLEALMASSPSVEVIGSFSDLSALEDLRPDVILAAVPQSELVPAPAIVLLTAEEQPP